MMAFATLTLSARITPMPCVPSSSLMITGAPPTRSIAGRTSDLSRTNVVCGMPMRWRLRICSDRSLSRELRMPFEELAQKTSICSNCRTTAVPKYVIEAPMRGSTAS
jgi:hypothetical protein